MADERTKSRVASNFWIGVFGGCVVLPVSKSERMRGRSLSQGGCLSLGSLLLRRDVQEESGAHGPGAPRRALGGADRGESAA